MRFFRVLMVILVLACLAPLFSMLVAQLIGDHYGCTVGIDSINPCMVDGKDIGETLTTLGAMGYFLFVTLPVLYALVPLWIVVELIAWIRRRRAAPAE